MPLLILSKHEMLTLSSCSRIKAEELSPVSRLYVEETVDFNGEKLQEAAKELVNSNYIVESAGKKLLAKELEPAFYILHRPEKIISFKRLSFADINEIYFCIRKEAAVQYTIRYDSLFEMLAYPFGFSSIDKWVAEEMFRGIDFLQNTIKPFKTELTADETIVLYAVINIYRNRIMQKKGALSAEEAWLTFQEIRSFAGFDELKGLIGIVIEKEKIKTYFRDNPNLSPVIESLIRKGLLTRSSRGLSYSDVSKDIFDPGNVSDSIIVKEVSEKENRITSLNILQNGYMLFSQADNNTDYCIQTFSSVTPLRELTQRMYSLKAEPKMEQKAEQNEKPKYCNNCGNKLKQGVVFCNNCGNKLQ